MEFELNRKRGVFGFGLIKNGCINSDNDKF